jgi:hypothetical protein
MFPFLRRRSLRHDTAPASARSRKRRFGLEVLEGRELMSISSEFLVNTKTINGQFLSDNATSANGSSVVVWGDSFSPTDIDIKAQRFNALGQKVGPEITVSASSLNEISPKVAMDSSGNFVVTWMQTLPSGDTNVVARRFNSAGTPVGSVVQVGVGTFREHNPDVAMDDQGHFVVAYVRDTNNNNPDVFAKRYDINNNLLNVVNVATTTRAETSPTIAMTPDGRFDVAWEDAFSATDHDIRMNSYSSFAQLTGSFGITFSSFNESSPSIAMDRFGNAVVAWEQAGGNGGHDIRARRVSSVGIQTSDFNVASTSLDERVPSVALNRNGGGFVVGYQVMSNQPTRVRLAEMSASNTLVSTFDFDHSFDAAVSMDANNNYMLTYTSLEFGDLNIKGRRGHLF